MLRLHHYSIHTERAYLEWIVRYVRFHRMQSRHDLFSPEPKIEAFLTDLAVNGNVAAATQNQAMNTLVFLYKRVLNHTLKDRANEIANEAGRADMSNLSGQEKDRFHFPESTLKGLTLAEVMLVMICKYPIAPRE